MTAPTFSSESTKRIIADVWGDEDALERQRANLRTRANVLAKEPAPQRAEALQLQRRTGVPWAVAELDIPEVRARDAYQQLGPVRVENSPAWASFLEGPLAPIALQNPENTRAIADAIDLRTLGAPTPSVLSAGYARGVHMTEVGKLGTRVYLDLASDADRVRFDYMRRNWPEVPDVPGYVDDVAALLAEQAPVLASIATYSATTAAGAGLVGLGSGPGAAVFAGGGAVAGAGYGSFVLEGGNAYAEFLDIAEEVFQESGEVIPHDAIRGMAMLVGVLNAGMEVGGIGLLLRITLLSRLKGRLTSKGATEIIKSKTLRPYLISFAKRMAQAMAVEGGTEGLQEVVNIAGAEILVEATTGQEVDFWSWENVERVLKAAAAGAVVGSAIQVGAAPIVLASERVALNRKTQAKEQQLDALNELVGSSELTGADLDAVRTWVQGMLEEGAGDTNLYVPAENLVELFQEDEALGEAMPGVLGQLAEALATGGDVVVPVADYVTHLNEHHETLKGVVRHGLGERNASEVDATSAEDEAALDAEMEALAAPPIEQEIADLEARIAELEQPIEGEPPPGAEAAAREALLGIDIGDELLERIDRLDARNGMNHTAQGLIDNVRTNLGDELADAGEALIRARHEIELRKRQRADAPTPRAAEAPELAELRQQLAEKQQQAQEAAAPSRGEQAAQTVLEKLIRQGVMRPEDAQFVASLMQAHAERRAEGVAGEKAFEQLEAMEVEGPEGQVAPPTTPAEELARVDIAPLLDTLREAPETLPPEVEQLSRILDNLGIDLDQMTNEEIISELQSRFAPTTLAQPIEGETKAQRNLRENLEAADAVEGRSTTESNKHGLMPHLRVPAQVPGGRDKALFLQGTSNVNAARQLAAIGEVLARHPEATASAENWSAMMADALASDDVPAPPYAFIENINGTGALDLLNSLAPGQIEEADQGFANGQAFRDAYTNGEISVEDTGRLFLWGFLSRGVSPYTQESLFIDSFEGIGQWIDAASDGSIQAKQSEYKKWAKTVAVKGSGQPGAGAVHNLNAFGKAFLFKMSEDAGDGSGRSRLQLIHDMMSDPNSTGPEIRRKFQEIGQGIGIDNKVVSFALLVAGFTDVMVLDRVQTREMWNDGRFGDLNLYDGFKGEGKLNKAGKVKRTVMTGSGLANLLNGARGLLIYEALERGLAERLAGIYSEIGRPDDASIGRYHWESWVASSNQEASHATIDAILAEARGVPGPLEGVMSKEGEYGAYAYGSRYGIDGAGVPYFLYSVPGVSDYKFSVDGFTAFKDALKKPKNGVVPTNFKVKESGNAPWFLRPEVNLERLAELAEDFGERYEADEISGVDARSGVDPPTTNRLAADQPDATAERGRGLATLEQPIDEAPGERQLGGVFHSSLGRALRTSQQRKMTKPQLRKFLEKSRVKKEEILWSALEEFIADKDSVNLDEALEAIHLVEVGEVMLGGPDVDADLVSVFVDDGEWTQVEGENEGVWETTARAEDNQGQESWYDVIWDEDAGNMSVKDAAGRWLDIDAPINQQNVHHVEEAIRSDVKSRIVFPEAVDGPAEHESYTLPGGENYRELLITLPRPSLDAIIEAGGTRDEYNRAVEAAGPAFEGGHYSDVPNVVVFVRFNERIDADGKRVLFIEEIQSDWHQEGREKGYADGRRPIGPDRRPAQALRADHDPTYWEVTNAAGEFIENVSPQNASTAEEAISYLTERMSRPSGVPDAPFKGTWPDLALKRMVAYAAQNGFDSVAWTTGAQQVERWSSAMRQVVDEISWRIPESGSVEAESLSENVAPDQQALDRYREEWDSIKSDWAAADAIGDREQRDSIEDNLLDPLHAKMVRETADRSLTEWRVVAIQPTQGEAFNLYVDADGMVRDARQPGSTAARDLIGKTLESVVGKDMAQQIMESEDGRVAEEGLTIGGKFFEDIYDKRLVQVANKIGKKFGAKVGRVQIGGQAPATAEDAALLDELGVKGTGSETATVHALPITDELQASVTDEGLALFQPIDEEGPRGPQPGSGGIRGSLTYDPELNQILMRFTEARNLSTALHESGHLFFVMMMQDAQTAGASPQLLADMQTALDYMGVEENRDRALGEAQRAAKAWAKKHGKPVPEVTLADVDVALRAGLSVGGEGLSVQFAAAGAHEVWARSFEAYLREGKAPSVELQSVFDRFKRWLLQVYRTLKRLDVELSPEIREVFDRLLATDEQIAMAREQERMLPAFDSAEAAGMTEAEYEGYLQSHGRRDIDAMQDMSKKILAELSRKATAEWRENFEKMRAEVEAEINAQPITKARHWLQFGTLLDEETPPELEAVKLDRDALEAIYGEPILRSLPGSGGNSVWRNEGGVHPDELASVLGFTSGDALVRALVKSENRNDAIEKETTRRMKETYGDILNDGTLPELVMKAMENDAKGNFLIRQGRILARRSGIAGTPQALARTAARRVIAGKTVRELSPHRYRLAEQRAAREVLEAVDAQDWEVANEAGRKQLLNHFLVVEATKAKDQSEKRVAALKRFTTKGVRQKIGMAGDIVVAETTGEEITEGETYLDRIDDLLDRIDLRKISAKAAARRTSLALFIANLKERATTEAIAIPAISPDLLHSLEEEDFRKPWQDLTVTELKDIADAVTSLAHVARLKNKLLKAKDQRDFAAIRDDLLASAEKNKRTDKPLAREPRLPKERKWRGIASFLAELRKVTSLLSELDNDEPGVFHDKVLFPMDEAGHWEHAELLKAGEALVGLFDRFSGNFLSRLGTTFRVSEPDVYRTQYVEALGAEFSKEGLLMILLNLGNAGNRQRLQSGDNFTDAQIEALLNDPSVFTKEDFDWAQKVWDFVGSYWGQISDKRKRVTGVRPERVEAVPLQTRFGTYPGGYLPIDYDRMLQGPAGRGSSPDAVQDTLRQMNAGGYVSAVTRHGFEEARLAEVHGMPLRLDFGVIFEHIQGVIHDLAFHEWMIDANRIFRDPSIALSIKQGYGHDAFRVIESALKSIAVGDVASSTGMNRVLNHLRRKTSVSILGSNFRTILLQYTGLLPAMEAHGAKWIAVGSRALSSGDKTYENSTMMVNRASFRTADSNRELREAQTEFRRVGVLKKNYETVGYTGIIFTQSHVDRVVWLGVYAKEMHEGSGDEVRAYAVADRAVLETQGGGQIKDLSELQTRDATTKILTAFMSYANVLQQREAQAWRRLGRRRREGGGTRKAVGDWARFLGSTQMIFFMSELITSIVIDTLLQDWDEDKEWYEYALDNYLFNGLLALANPIPILREVTGTLRGYQYGGPASLRVVPAFGGVLVQTKQVLAKGTEELDSALAFALLDFVGTFTGFPAPATKKLIRGADYMEETGSWNPANLLFGPPRENRR